MGHQIDVEESLQENVVVSRIDYEHFKEEDFVPPPQSIVGEDVLLPFRLREN